MTCANPLNIASTPTLIVLLLRFLGIYKNRSIAIFVVLFTQIFRNKL